MVLAADLVGEDFSASLARPGGNVTGRANQIPGARLQSSNQAPSGMHRRVTFLKGAREGSLSRARRRRFLIEAGALLAAPLPGLAQQPAAAIPRIGFLGVATPAAWATRIDALQAGFRDLGYIEGKNIVVEYRFAQGQYDRLPALAAELVRLRVDVIVTHASLGAVAAKQATATNPIPVVMTNVGDAVGFGLVASLARPGGNITGDTFFTAEIAAKRLELLKEAFPRVRRVAVLANPDTLVTASAIQAMEATAKALDVTLQRFDVRDPADLEGTFAAMARNNPDGLSVIEDVKLISSFRTIAELAIRLRLPSIGFVDYADAGGLFGYGADFRALYRRVAVFVDKILKGTRPADIPVERAAKFEFVINTKTAQAIGLAIASASRLRADRLIE
jgi:putative ABC transport system substrate-binding protein